MCIMNDIKNFAKATTTVMAIVLLAACSKQEFGLGTESKAFEQKVIYNTEVDVLVVIDTSGSMAQHQDSFAMQTTNFISALDKTRLDYHIAVTTMDMGRNGAKGKFLQTPEGSPAVLRSSQSNLSSILASRIKAGESGSTVERGLEAMKAALSSPNMEGGNAGFLRPNALLAVIFLSNEEDESAPADYVGFLDALKPPLKTGERSWIAHFIGVLPSDSSCHSSKWNYHDPGMKYIGVAEASGGRTESICTTDLQVAVDKIKARIIEMITEYSLGDRKARKDSIKVYVNGHLLAEDPANGWTYDEEKNSILFHGTGVPLPGGTMRVDFEPEEIK